MLRISSWTGYPGNIAEKGPRKRYKECEIVKKYTKAHNTPPFLKLDQIETFCGDLKQQSDFPRILDPIYDTLRRDISEK